MAATRRTTFPALGTNAVIAVTDERRLDLARAEVESEIAAIDLACSRFRADSELEAVNRAGGRRVAVSALLITAIEAALRGARLSDGDVDPTVGRSLRILGYDRDFEKVAPTGPPVVRVVPVAGWRTIELDPGAGTVRVPSGVRLDLGATAKALASDRAAARAAAAAGCGVLVGLGGDIATSGEAPPGGWTVRVTDWHAAPASVAGELVTLDGGALATSSTTVRTWQRDGQRLHHIVDPSTGRPAAEVWRTVSVAAASCVDANVATTAAIVRGESCLPWLRSLGLPARLVRADGSVVRLGGWPERRAA